MLQRSPNLSPNPLSVRQEHDMQHTLATSVELHGVGLHSGQHVTVNIMPAAEGTGRVFVRTDLADLPLIPARADRVVQTLLSTELAAPEISGALPEAQAKRQSQAKIRTVEHLLAALVGMGVDNAQIEVNGAEIPLLDGSAQIWTEAIAQAGVVPQSAPRHRIVISEPIWIQEKDAFVAALPASHCRLTYGIDFASEAIGQQWQSWSPDGEDFQEAIAPARTFGLAHQVEALRQQGLIKGGSLDNALVCDDQRWLNPPLRYSNEPVRHKLLDLVGDLSLAGSLPQAHVMAYKASHHLHVQLANALHQLAEQ
ncbi:MAG: UDP-3-O-acyl-N-acetylglucosamine deacetylase [Elainellaceae cyanobacterium]